MELRDFTLCVVVLVCLHSVTSLNTPPKITSPDKQLTDTVISGASYNLQCQAEGTPTPTYKWTLNNEEITADNIDVDSATGDLTITGFSDNDEGAYQCIAKNEISPGKPAVAMSPAVTLQKVRFTGDWPESTDISSYHNEGDYVELECSDHPVSVPTAQYSWYLAEGDNSEGEVQTGERIYVDEKGSLHFMYITKEDENGELRYKCGLYNSEMNMIRLGSEKDVHVTEATGAIPQSAAINKFSTNPAKFLLTKNAELECVFSGNPIPDITWYVNDVQITNNEDYEIVEDTFGRKLIVKNIEESDERLYKCKGSNTVGSSEADIFLDVTSGPIWVESLSSQTLVEGTNAVFKCEARAAVGDDDLNTPIWFRNGEPMNVENTGKYEFSNSGKTLTVVNLNKTTDITCFQCNVSNNIGYEFADGCLNIVEPIRVTTQPNLDQVVEYGDFANLTVIGTTDPALVLKYRWRFKNDTYDNRSPPFVTFNETTLEAYINTSALNDEEFDSISGTYFRDLYTDYEVKTVAINISLYIPEDVATVAAAGASLWWIPIIVAILVLIILIIIISCLVCWARERGTYPLDKKERANDIDPEKDIADGGFHDLANAPGDDEYPLSKTPLFNPTYEYDDDDDVNPEKDDESLEAYAMENQDMARFNEDGSFIGQYTSKKK